MIKIHRGARNISSPSATGCSYANTYRTAKTEKIILTHHSTFGNTTSVEMVSQSVVGLK
jgi:hypothetical protein